jgi:hypothetical protein
MLVDWRAASIICAVIQDRQPDFQGGDAAADREEGPRSDSWWDRVAERWPHGGRFPSLICIDQSA